MGRVGRLAVGIVGVLVIIAAIAYAVKPDKPVKDAGQAVGYTPAPKAPAALFIGDSFTDGTGAAGTASDYAHQVAAFEGWDAGYNAFGGTGFLAKGPVAEALPIVQRTAGYENPDVQYVVLAAGLNDRTALEDTHKVTETQLASAIRTTFANIKAGFPNAKLIVLGPWWPGPNPTPGMKTIDRLVQAQTAASGGSFIDTIGEKWFTADNRPNLISSDCTHPNQAGHDYLAGRVEQALAALNVRPVAQFATKPTTTVTPAAALSRSTCGDTSALPTASPSAN